MTHDPLPQARPTLHLTAGRPTLSALRPALAPDQPGALPALLRQPVRVARRVQIPCQYLAVAALTRRAGQLANSRKPR